MENLRLPVFQQFYLYYGDNFKIECPTESGKMMNLFEASKEIADRLISTFTSGRNGKRPLYGGSEKFRTDPNWRDLILFYEYFELNPERLLKVGKSAAFVKGIKPK